MHANDTVHAEPSELIDAPNYRVNFWQRSAPDRGWNLEAYVITEAKDVAEVLQWATDQAAGRRFELFVEAAEEHVLPFGTPRTSGLIRILGDDPNLGEATEIGLFSER